MKTHTQPKHTHNFTRSKPTASVETCTCGKFRFTEHSGEPIIATTAAAAPEAPQERFQHDACPKCGTASLPAEQVPDQALRICPKCQHDWFEDLNSSPIPEKPAQHSPLPKSSLEAMHNAESLAHEAQPPTFDEACSHPAVKEIIVERDALKAQLERVKAQRDEAQKELDAQDLKVLGLLHQRDELLAALKWIDDKLVAEQGADRQDVLQIHWHIGAAITNASTDSLNQHSPSRSGERSETP